MRCLERGGDKKEGGLRKCPMTLLTTTGGRPEGDRDAAQFDVVNCRNETFAVVGRQDGGMFHRSCGHVFAREGEEYLHPQSPVLFLKKIVVDACADLNISTPILWRSGRTQMPLDGCRVDTYKLVVGGILCALVAAAVAYDFVKTMMYPLPLVVFLGECVLASACLSVCPSVVPVLSVCLPIAVGWPPCCQTPCLGVADAVLNNTKRIHATGGGGSVPRSARGGWPGVVGRQGVAAAVLAVVRRLRSASTDRGRGGGDDDRSKAGHHRRTAGPPSVNKTDPKAFASAPGRCSRQLRRS